MAQPRIGIFGGTFDPIHKIHLKIAISAVKQLKLRRLYFIPAYFPPHKQGRIITPARHRLKMIQLAIQSNPQLRISRYEIKHKGLSYTVDTLNYFKKRFPASKIYLLLGSDMFCQFNTWRNPEKILSLSTLAVYERTGWSILDKTQYPFCRITGIQYSLSATEIRCGIGNGSSMRTAVPDSVLKYIKDKKLYVHSSAKI